MTTIKLSKPQRKLLYAIQNGAEYNWLSKDGSGGKTLDVLERLKLITRIERTDGLAGFHYQLTELGRETNP